MNMSKNQVVMAAIGGVTLVAAAALGYFVFDAYSSKGEAVEESEGSKDSVRRLLRGDVSPDKESELAYKKNGDTLAGWTEAALATAAAGDRAVRDDINPAAFKQQLVSEARALSELEGGVDGKVVKGGFAFGFPDFVAGDKLPEKDQLPRLQRLWGDVRYLVEKLQACGVVEIVRIEPAAVAAAQDKAQAGEEKKPRARKSKGAKKGGEEVKPAYTVEQYAVDFRAKPAALVKVLNALATSDRFVVVDSMSFAREGDMIAAALGEGEKSGASAQQPAAGGRRRRRRGEEQPAAEASAFGENASGDASAEKKGIVNDPVKESPFLVKAVVSTYDFGTAAKSAAAAPAEGDGAANADGATKKEGEE